MSEIPLITALASILLIFFSNSLNTTMEK